MKEQSVFPDARRQGLCLLCRRSGHWKKDCPELGRQSNNKISVLDNQSICIDESESSISSKSEDGVNKVFPQMHL